MTDPKPVVLDPRIVDRIVNDAIDFEVCSQCEMVFRTRSKETFVAWLDIGDDLLCGPLCRCCFDRHLRDKLGDAIVSDIKVYHINLHSNPTIEALEYIQAMSPRRRIFESMRYEAPNSRHLRLTDLV
jgi:hypothetical protein